MPFTSETARIYGRKGGLKTKERLQDDPNYYRRTGQTGGEKILKEKGRAYYSEISKLRQNVREQS